ncbi:cupin domain-containing protein [Glycomyces buryatensis]|uniref:Cupin domain-containing protein n=1 Tax=Glycomyces buryatensis TaxID=2570927 RepID=A0A4S8PZ66_9ACTN|nr:cupin domain-containing protein [Glycomyces buryatensis]THV36960.1 cupin domain-containing protein [Glycomyces buryatensis]
MSGFPGGTAVSLVTVYDWPTLDGQAGGSPHLHTASTEGYVVTHGTGAVETLSGDGYQRHELSHGTVLWFTPGTVHRLINGSGDLQVTVVMQNAGIPEAGDAVFTFPEEVMADAAAYAAAATAPAAPDLSDTDRGAAARTRRDLAVEGYLALRARVETEGAEAMRPFWDRAANLVSGRAGDWRKIWEAGPKAQSDTTGEHLTALAAADGAHLCDSHVGGGGAPARKWGMCGRLETWDLRP